MPDKKHKAPDERIFDEFETNFRKFMTALKACEYSEEQLKFLFAVISLAKELHKKQTRDEEHVDYFTHLVRVARRVLDGLQVLNLNREDEVNVLAATFLHDAVEDQTGRIIEKFGKQKDSNHKRNRDLALNYIQESTNSAVRDWVNQLSKPVSSLVDKEDSYFNWLKHIWNTEDKVVTLIKIADLIDNIRATVNHFDRNDEKSRRRTLKYHKSLRIFLCSKGYEENLSEDGQDEFWRKLEGIFSEKFAKEIRKYKEWLAYLVKDMEKTV